MENPVAENVLGTLGAVSTLFPPVNVNLTNLWVGLLVYPGTRSGFGK